MGDFPLYMFGVDRDSMASLTNTKGWEFIVSKAVDIKIGKTPIGKTPLNDPNDGSQTKISKGNKPEERETSSYGTEIPKTVILLEIVRCFHICFLIL